ncbi:MAG: 4Fe-4S cluster-binding domain-containing protein [Leptospira sp.]|nr:4Fe-4S cluster-binding domain-containing protein [Leptospira sp.]NCS93694.1 4Fe-4S cluster-binding domain-containing protein [Leptospira sp.]
MPALIHEIYYSLSGEGITTGVPTIFVRIAGCSLRCGITLDGRKLWCDTGYALSHKAGTEIKFDHIIKQIESLQPDHGAQVLITGGEPLEGENRQLTVLLCNEFSKICKNQNYPFPRIETNGAESIEGLDNMVFTLDYKLPGSGMEERMDIQNLSILRNRNNPLDELKFVIRDKIDFDRSVHIVHEYQPNTNILYSPVHGEVEFSELAEWIKINPVPQARLSLQMHKILWGDKRSV